MLVSFAENIPNLGLWTMVLNESGKSKALRYTKQLGQNRVTSVLLNLFWLDCLALSFDVLSIFMHAQNAGWNDSTKDFQSWKRTNAFFVEDHILHVGFA